MIGSRFQKKRILGLFIVLFALGLSSLTADTPRTLYTPRNTLVPDTYVCDEMSVAARDSIDDLYASLYPNAEQLKLWGEQYSSSGRYNCHGYAWHMIGDDAINDPVWIGYWSGGQVHKYWEDESYSEVSVQYATTVKYSGDHSATTTDQTNIYISKWRFYPLMRHHKDYHPGYGNPSKYLRRNPATPSDFATIAAAVSDAVSGQIVHVDPGAPTMSSNITVPSDVTLSTHTSVSVPSGKTLTFASGSTVNVVDGPITQSGTGVISISVSGGATYCPRALLKDGSTVLGIYSGSQTAINTGSSGDDVYLGTGSYPGSIDMKSGVDVIGAGISSTTISGSITFDAIGGFATLSGLRTSMGVMLDDCGSYASLSNIKATTIDIDHSGPQIEYVELNSSLDNGIYAHNSAYAEISEGEIQGHEYGILIVNVGTVVVEYIEFCENYPYDICADGGTESAETFECIWSGDPEDYTYGSVNYDPSDEICEGLKKAVSARATPSTLLNSPPAGGSDQGREAYDDAYSLYRAIRNDLRLDVKSGLEPEPRKYAAEYSDAIGQFKQIVAEYPESRYSVLALGVIADCYRSLGESESVAGYLGGILKDARYEQLHLYAQNLLIFYHRRTGDIQAALDLSDTILSSSPPEDLACDVLYGKGVIYQHNLGDHDKAVEMFLAVLAQYPDHPTAQSALTRLEIMGESVVIPDKPATEQEPAEELALSGYPNPFNPTATIRFGLPEAGRVTLVVYDLMGREVVHLVDGYRDAGWQAVVWNGRDAKGREVPTGIYIARLATPQETRAIKLVMMK